MRSQPKITKSQKPWCNKQEAAETRQWPLDTAENLYFVLVTPISLSNIETSMK